jgi:hypothetical protein
MQQLIRVVDSNLLKDELKSDIIFNLHNIIVGSTLVQSKLMVHLLVCIKEISPILFGAAVNFHTGRECASIVERTIKDIFHLYLE